MTELEKLKKENKELKEKIQKYEDMPHAEFFTALLQGVAHITQQIKDKTLDFDNDPFAKNVFQLAKESDKIMSSLEKGASFFVVQEKASSKKIEKSNTVAI